MDKNRRDPYERQQRVEELLGNLLRWGVITAALVVLVGAIVYLARNGATVPDYSTFRGEPTAFRSFAGIIKDALKSHGRGIIQIGLILLIATPIARVAFSFLTFARERDWVYVWVTLAVLGVLVYGLAGGRV